MSSNDLNLDLELATMQSIATALGRLDAGARARTLLWLRLRFDPDGVSAQPTAAPASALTAVPALQAVANPTHVAAYDDALSVDTLGDLFECAAGTPSERFEWKDAEPPAEAAPHAVTGVLSQLAAGFQELAQNWGHACSAPEEATPVPRPLSATS